jgi:hypothetical protein
MKSLDTIIFGRSGDLPAAVFYLWGASEKKMTIIFMIDWPSPCLLLKEIWAKWNKRVMRLSFVLLLDKLTGIRMKWQRGKPDKTIPG